jgi:hypothetical protein
MIANPKISMRVRINIFHSVCLIGPDKVEEHYFDSTLADTGVIVNIEHFVMGHSPKHYYVKLDPPNRGTMHLLSTQRMEKI